MTITRFISLLASLVLMTATGQATANTIDANSGQINDCGIGNTCFHPTTVLDPFPNAGEPTFRYQNEDWGWMHGGLDTTGFASASLTITAWDVDNPVPDIFRPGVLELNLIQGKLGGTTWTDIGYLLGTSNSWELTEFTLDFVTWEDTIKNGLELQILIDQNDSNFYGVGLEKSVLALNPIPIPAAAWLFGTALFGLAGFSRRKKRS